jgi:outer membrane protein assembly factor BamB
VVGHLRTSDLTGPVLLGGRWAFVPNMSKGTVTQIDRGSGKTVATIDVADPQLLRAQGCAPDSVHAWDSRSWGWRACDTPYAIAWDGSQLLALDNGSKQLVRVDPARHGVIARIALPGTGWAIAADETTAWVSGWDDDSLYAIDLQSGHLRASIRGLDQGPSTMAIGFGSVWVVCARGVGELDRIDPSTFEVTGRYPIGPWSNAVVASDAIYIHGSNGGDISRVDPTTGTTVWRQTSPAFLGRSGIDQIAVTSDGIWLSGPSTALINPQTGEIAGNVAVSSMAVAAAGNELWLVELDGSVAELRRT